MDFGRITDPNAWRNAMANLLRRGEEVGEYIESAPQKAGQAILDARARQNALMGKAFADPTNPLRVTDKQAMTEAGMNMLTGPLGIAPAGITAWHGSPHTFDKFDISKVGTGEGAQSYGYGMYFAEAPEVAKQYQAALSDTKYFVDGKPLKGNDAWAAQFLHTFEDDALPKRVDVQTAINKANEILKDTPTKTEIINKIKDLNKSNLNVESGSLYKVDIPDEYIPNMLDWDKPIKEQTKYIKDKLTELGISSEMTGKQAYDFAKEILKMDMVRTPTPADVSSFLNSKGIKGIRYLDQGSRTSKITNTPIAQLDAKIDILKKDISSGLGNKEVMERQLKNLQAERARTTNQTSNFVVFDPKDVKILERNNKPLSRKEILQEELDKLSK